MRFHLTRFLFFFPGVCALTNARNTILCLISIASVLFAAGSVSAKTGELPQLLVMSAVSDDAQSRINEMRPLANYMEKRLAHLGVTHVDILIAVNHDQMVRFIRDGRVDWVTETAYSAALLEKKAGAEIILRRWKQGVPSYNSVMFVRKDSQIQSLAELTGTSIAFQHPGSTTGYFVPMSLLRSSGLALRQMRSVRDKSLPGFVNYLFSGAEYNSAMWVHKGIVSAAVLSNVDWNNEDAVPKEVRKDLRIIDASAQLPRAVELVRGDLHPALKSAIRETLLAAHQDREAQSALSAYQGTSRFDALDEDSLAVLRSIRASLGGGAGGEESAP